MVWTCEERESLEAWSGVLRLVEPGGWWKFQESTESASVTLVTGLIITHMNIKEIG